MTAKPNRKKKKASANIFPELAELIAKEGLTADQLTIALPAQEDNQPEVEFQRNEILLYDGTKACIWKVASFKTLYRGDKEPPADLMQCPPEYAPLLIGIEFSALSACQLSREHTDDEFIATYAAMLNDPDGKDLGLLHRMIWQSAALAMGLQPYSQQEFIGVLTSLGKFANTFRKDAVSCNYVRYLCKQFANAH